MPVTRCFSRRTKSGNPRPVADGLRAVGDGLSKAETGFWPFGVLFRFLLVLAPSIRELQLIWSLKTGLGAIIHLSFITTSSPIKIPSSQQPNHHPNQNPSSSPSQPFFHLQSIYHHQPFPNSNHSTIHLQAPRWPNSSLVHPLIVPFTPWAANSSEVSPRCRLIVSLGFEQWFSLVLWQLDLYLNWLTIVLHLNYICELSSELWNLTLRNKFVQLCLVIQKVLLVRSNEVHCSPCMRW